MDYERIQNSASIAKLLRGDGGFALPSDLVCGMYIFVGLGRPLYVGISQDPVFRVHQHLGLADAWSYYRYPHPELGTPIGRLVHTFRPDSLDWRVYFPSAADVANYMNAYPHTMRDDYEADYSIFAFAERYLIYELNCPVNSAHSRRGDGNRDFWELVWAREGTPDKSAGDYLNL